MDGMENKKRDRATNFNIAEVRLLIEIVYRYRALIENKKTDAVTNKDKDAAWKNVTEIFNATSGVTARNAKTLKLKYEGLKKGTKKKSSIHRQELYRTGGGESSATPFTDVEEKILSICSNIHGLNARNDSDIIAPALPIQNDDTIEIIEIDNATIEEVEECTGVQNITQVENENKEAGEDQTKQVDSDVVHDDRHEKWKTWTPRALKTRVTPILRPKVSTSSVTTKLDELSTARCELVELQKQLAVNEIKYKEIEHDLIMKQKKEEHEARMLHLFNEEKRKQQEHDYKLKQYIDN